MDRRSDLVIAVLVVLIGSAVLILARDIRPTGPVVDPIGPRAMPYIIGTLFVVGGCWIAGARLRRWRREAGPLVETDGEPDEPGVPASALQAFTVMGAAVVYAASLPLIGYAIATPLFVVVALKAMKVRSWTSVVAAALVYTLATYVIFAVYMRVDLPLGPLTEAFRALGLAR